VHNVPFRKNREEHFKHCPLKSKLMQFGSLDIDKQEPLMSEKPKKHDRQSPVV
jgi:hypothetical protein